MAKQTPTIVAAVGTAVHATGKSPAAKLRAARIEAAQTAAVAAALQRGIDPHDAETLHAIKHAARARILADE